MYMPLCPTPSFIREGENGYSIPAVTCARISGSVPSDMAEEMKRLWHGFTCGTGKLKFEAEDLGSFSVCFGAADDLMLCREDSYAIEVTPHGARIQAVDARALMQGWSTFVQLLYPVSMQSGSEEFRVSEVFIRDHSPLPLRMIHVCIFPETTIEILERTIRLAAFYKFTHIIFEPWGTVRFDTLPEMGWKDRSIAKEDLRSLAKLARSLGLEVVPMINHLGHATQSRGCAGRHTVLNQAPRYEMLFEPDGWTWCLSEKETHRILRGIRAELMDICGEGGYFHLGCDEVESYASCPRCRNLDKVKMFADWINGLSEELNGQGRRAIIWGDALLEQARWQRPSYATSKPEQQTHLALDSLDRMVMIADWQYFLTDGTMPTAEYFKSMGFDVLSCSWDLPDNAKSLSSSADTLGLAGTMLTTWHHLPAMLRHIDAYGAQAWQGSAYAPPAYGFGSSAILRKVMPRERFEESGFYAMETDPWPLKQVQ